MPQPLSSVAPNASFEIGSAGARYLETNPQLASVALEAIASWSNVEGFLLRMFEALLGGNGSVAVAMYRALETQSAKTKAIRAAANSVLSERPDELRVLKALLAIAQTNEKSRNKLAHWVWGLSRDIPDAFLLADSRNFTGDVDRSVIYVYREVDFRRIIEDNDRLCGFGLDFLFVLRDHPANAGGRLIRRLIEAPQIAERLIRQAPDEVAQ
jgi:hypothetical protein